MSEDEIQTWTWAKLRQIRSERVDQKADQLMKAARGVWADWTHKVRYFQQLAEDIIPEITQVDVDEYRRVVGDDHEGSTYA